MKSLYMLYNNDVFRFFFINGFFEEGETLLTLVNPFENLSTQMIQIMLKYDFRKR